MTVLTVALDPALTAHRAPIVWTLREVLVALGYQWREVPFGASADLVYARAGYGGAAGVLIESTGWSGTLPAGHATDRWVPVDVDELGRRVVSRDLVRELHRIIGGTSESTWRRDRRGELDVPQAWRGGSRMAIASRLVDALGRVLVDSGRPVGLPRWPDGAQAAAAFAHDVEYPEIVKIIEPVRVLRRQGWRAARTAWETVTGRRHHWHFESWMAEEDARGVRSAFYFAAHRGSLAQFARRGRDPVYDIAAPRVASMIQRLQANGWEIGLRASYDAWRDPMAIAREKTALEAVSGQPVAGVRHQQGRLDPDEPATTLARHAQAGFSYDASLGFDRFMGFRRGLAWPFRPWDPRARTGISTLDVPICWTDEHSFRYWRGGREAADEALDELVSTVLDVGGCFVGQARAHAVDTRLYPGRFHVATALMRLVADDPRFWKTTPEALARHWRTRQQLCESSSVGLEPRESGAVATLP